MKLNKINKNKRIDELAIKKRKILRRGLPAELLVEIHKWLPMDFGIGILVAIPSALIARHNGPVLKRQFEHWKMNFKWDARKGPLLTRSGGHTVHGEMPIRLANPGMLKIPYLAGYYEVKIEKIDPRSSGFSIDIGFCDRKFPLEGRKLGNANYSIGISSKHGMRIDGTSVQFANNLGFFKVGDTIGIGLVHCYANSLAKCFAVCNGELLKKVELSEKFADIKLYSAATLHFPGDSISANFSMMKTGLNAPKFMHEIFCEKDE